MTHGSLFSGIGGFEEAAERAGIPTLWNCEYEKYQRHILQQRYQASAQYDDVRTVTELPYVDIISGGFPCQDISVAGKMEGIGGGRSGLWSEMFRICGEVRPKYILIENSPALLIRGFERVLCNLSGIGYHAEWQCISNLSFGYPHKRKRLYVIAYSDEIRQQGNICIGGGFKPIFKQWTPNPHDGYSCAERIYQIPASDAVRNGDGFRHWSHRVGSCGNAVNPTVVHYLFDCILKFNNSIS